MSSELATSILNGRQNLHVLFKGPGSSLWADSIKSTYKFTSEPFSALCPAGLDSAPPQHEPLSSFQAQSVGPRGTSELPSHGKLPEKDCLNTHLLGKALSAGTSQMSEGRPGWLLLLLLGRASPG